MLAKSLFLLCMWGAPKAQVSAEGRDIERAIERVSARCDRCLTNTHPGHMVKMHNEFEFWLTIITITPSLRLWINPPEKGTILRYSQSYPHYQQFSTIYITLRL